MNITRRYSDSLNISGVTRISYVHCILSKDNRIIVSKRNTLAAVDENIGWLSQPGASFVTLTQWGELSACIGSLQACDPMIEDVSNNVVSAALHDFCFLPLSVDELNTINLEVALLSELRPLTFINEADALAKLRQNIDGVVFEYGYHSIFLPQVWESLQQPRQFLVNLKSKAKLQDER